jgi:methionine--tRNA ligase beta chain
MATIEDFKKLEIRAGQIVSAEKVEGSDKLVKLSVDFGESGKKQIIAGISMHFPDLNLLIGKKFAFAYNLEPRMLKGLESQGMILACGEGEAFSLLSISDSITPGSLVR